MIMQRWTKLARHVLPADLAQYNRDNPALLAQTYRHSSLMLKALKLVDMGDSNAQCHTIAMKIIEDGIDALAEFSKDKDGLGLSHNQGQEAGAASVPDELDEFPQ